jgi:hypothetical protein
MSDKVLKTNNSPIQCSAHCSASSIQDGKNDDFSCELHDQHSKKDNIKIPGVIDDCNHWMLGRSYLDAHPLV